MVKRIVAVIGLASVLACGLNFDRYDPDASRADAPNGSEGDAANDIMSAGDVPAADGGGPGDSPAEAVMDSALVDAAPDMGADVSPPRDGGGPDGADAGDSGTGDGPACGANGEPCCSGGTCQQGLTCRGSTCRP
jgi:hypothetical protein